MERTLLVFPDTQSLAQFVIKNSVANAEINTREQTLSAPLNDDDIITACTEYGAHSIPRAGAITPYE